MVIDTLENFERYISLNPLFGKVAEFLKQTDLNKLEDGKHIIIDGDLFVNIDTTESKDPSNAVLETHVRMVDIQIPLNASETYGYTPLSALPEVEYNDAKDIRKYGDLPAQSYVTCEPGMFVIFFPEDGHAPCISATQTLHKAIFKVKA